MITPQFSEFQKQYHETYVLNNDQVESATKKKALKSFSIGPQLWHFT